MTGFDFIVLGIVGIAAVGGFMRGFAQEILSLAAWILMALAVRYLHVPLSVFIAQYLGNTITTALLAFALLLLIPSAAMKLISSWAGNTTRNSLLGPIDRVLGFGFGALKGTVIVAIAFSLLVLGYDTVWGYKGRPTWMTTARTYEFVDTSSRSIVQMLAERHDQLVGESTMVTTNE